MKKVLAMFLIGAMLLNLAACGSTTSGSNETKNETQMEDKNQISSAEAQADDMEKAVSGERPTQGNGKIGFSVHTLGDEFFANLDTAVHQRLEAAGYKVTTISCEGSAAKQVSDIENLIAMDCEAIFFFAWDPSAIADVCKRGREAGIKMYGLGCTFEDKDAYDKIVNSDQAAQGLGAAQMASDWIDEKYPDAEDQSIEVAVLVYTGTVDSDRRSEAELKISELNSKANVVGVYDLAGASDQNVKAQEYAEMMQSEHPNLKCIIAFGGDSALGCNEVYMRDASLNRDEFAIFSVDATTVIYEEINKSKANDSLYRGTVSTGDDLSIDIYDCLVDADLEYMDENRCIYKPITIITADNVDQYLN